MKSLILYLMYLAYYARGERWLCESKFQFTQRHFSVSFSNHSAIFVSMLRQISTDQFINKMNNRFCFMYPDENGTLTERFAYNSIISETNGCIDAFYQHNHEIRTFKLTKMFSVTDMDTGEIILNKWKYFGLTESLIDQINSVTFNILPAIKAIKFFCLSTRGLRKKESEKIQKFIREFCEGNQFSDTDLDDWLRNLWTVSLYKWRNGEIEEYSDLLNSIPISLREKCHEIVISIATGSGRKLIDQKLRERIDMEFSLRPVVQEQQKSFGDY